MFPTRPECKRIASAIDRSWLEILRADGRQIGRFFAERSDVSDATVSRRLSIMKESSLVDVRGYLSPFDAGVGAISMVRFKTATSPDQFATALAGLSCCYRVATIFGQSLVVALMAGECDLSLLANVDSILGDHPSVSIENACPVLRIIPPREARQPANHRKTIELDRPTDRQRLIQARLIQAIQKDFRATVASIATTVGVSAPSVAALIARMTEQGEIRHIVDTDPRFLNRPLCAQLRITVRKNIQTTAQAIAEQLDPDWVFLCLGHEHIVAEIAVHDEAELLRWQHNVERMPDVQFVTPEPFAAVYKRSFDWFFDSQNSHQS